MTNRTYPQWACGVLLAAAVGCAPGAAPTSAAEGASTGVQPGLVAEYFQDELLASRVSTAVVPEVDVDWGSGGPVGLPSNGFSVRWTGSFIPRFSEAYTLSTQSDDGVRLWVDGKLVIDDWTLHAVREDSAAISLEAGRSYSMRMEYYEHTGLASARLLWASAHEPKTVIPTAQLSTCASACGGDPSRQTPPGSDAAWTQVFVDDFSGTALDPSRWWIFNGNGNSITGPRGAAHAVVSGGTLKLETYRDPARGNAWVGASVGTGRFGSQTYGKYLVRMRFDAGVGMRGVALLWPVTGWPPEVDFFEIGSERPSRDVNVITNHYLPGNQMEHHVQRGDFTQWHTVGVEWTPNRMDYTLDGVVVSSTTAHVPNVPMWLGLTSAASLSLPPDSTTPSMVALEVDWVAIYQVR